MEKLELGQTAAEYIEAQIADIKKQAKGGKILLGLSGGVDSSVCAALISKAVGKQLTCVFVDHGLMRYNEGDEIVAAFKDWDINLIRVDAEKRFLTKLKGVTDPEKKRKIIGAEFVRVFEEEAAKVKADYLAQGTIYPDIKESGGKDKPVIKSHHNVGGLPDDLKFKGIIEPLKALYKKDVRAVGRALGASNILIDRQPFPGPGLGIRVLGELTKKSLDCLRLADHIYRNEIANAKIDSTVDQYFAVLTPIKTVGIKNGQRTYDNVLVLRAVTTGDFMNADFARIPYELLAKISQRITTEVDGIGRVVYDITSKPPGTIEWE